MNTDPKPCFNLTFWIDKITKSSIWIRNWIRIRVDLKCWIRIRIKTNAMHNPTYYFKEKKTKSNCFHCFQKRCQYHSHPVPRKVSFCKFQIRGFKSGISLHCINSKSYPAQESVAIHSGPDSIVMHVSRVSDPYSFFTDPDPDPEDPDGGQYGSGSNPDPGL